ncbi:MAG: LysE family transporter, partial [Thermacetogeniaceae bacterium]
LAVTIKESLEQGWPAGFFITTGHAVAEIAILCLFALGLSTVIQLQWITAVVGIIGGLVLFIMGSDMLMGALRDRVGLDLNGGDKPAGQITPGSIGRAVGAGVIVSAANPYWIIWWLTIGVMYVAEALKYGWLGLGFFYTGHILADYVWYVLIAVIAATGKKFLTAAVYKGIIAGCGVLMMILALYFSLQGIKAII